MRTPCKHPSDDSPVFWKDSVTPFSSQFNDIYHTSSGALAQAQHVFLQGCGLPENWKNTQHFTILETGFGLGINFMATWQAWRQDTARCTCLHYVSLEIDPVKSSDIVKSVQNIPQLQTLALRLAAHYPLRLPGMYRLVFDEEELGQEPYQVMLTLVFGDAHQQLPLLRLWANAIYLDGFSPAKNPTLWDNKILQTVAKLAAPGAMLSTWCVAGSVRRGLQQQGFDICKTKGLAPKREALTGIFRPRAFSRKLKSMPQISKHPQIPQVVVIGAGLSGATICHALARRGWQVTLVDQHAGPAQQASGLPMGLALPYISADDSLLSQLTRSGVEWLKHIIEQCNLAPQFWSGEPVEQLVKYEEEIRMFPSLGKYAKELFEPGITAENQPCRYFHQALRVEVPALVQALLRHSPGIQYLWNTKVAKIERTENSVWQISDVQKHVCLQTSHVVIAAAMESLPLCGLNNNGIVPNRGQIALGLPMSTVAGDMPPARTGHGHFVFPLRSNAGWSWSMGSTFSPGNTDEEIHSDDFQKLFDKLCVLSPRTAQILQPQFEQLQLGAFVQIRSTTTDHLPLVGSVPDILALHQLNPHHLDSTQCPVLPGLYILSSLGSRGLALGAWCAEFLASIMNSDPWPFTARQANAVMPARFELRRLRKIPGKS